MASTLGTLNPLRYRGYVYDTETGLYYLQSRYYNPTRGRFLNADAFTSTGQGLLGNNMFAYCGNNPINCVDSSGNFTLYAMLGAAIGGAVAGAIIGTVSYLVSSGISGTEVTAEGLLTAIGIGAFNGALGGVAGLVNNIVVKGLLCAAVGAVSGIYAGISTDGSLGEKIAVGVSTATIATVCTYAGTKIDTNNLSAGATAFATFSSAMAVSVPGEIAVVSSQKAINQAAEKNNTPVTSIRPSRARPHNYVTVLMLKEAI